MLTLYSFVAQQRVCSYLPNQTAQLRYELVADLTAQEYLRLMLDGWRRFGHTLFRPACPACQECRSLRIRVNEFVEQRRHRRNRRANQDITLRIGPPGVSEEKLDLYDRYHAFQTSAKGWPEHEAKNAQQYAEGFVLQPFPVEEWCYYQGDRLVGVGYVDSLEDAPPDLAGQQGLSAIYFFWEPELRERGLGTWNVLSLIDIARSRGLPYVYLGYYVEGCPSMAYKPTFRPNDRREEDGVWRAFR
ncbi:MAG: arginyltransferase [Gemmataceae bacterium]